MHTGVFEILTIVLLYQIQTPLRRYLYDRCDDADVRRRFKTQGGKEGDRPRHCRRVTVIDVPAMKYKTSG